VLSGDERVRWIDLRLVGDTRLPQVRSKVLSKPTSGFLRFPHIHDAKAIRTFTDGVNKQILLPPTSDFAIPVAGAP
jgi:hypothetical protein